MSKRRASNKNRQPGETKEKGAIPFWAASLVAILTFLTIASLASRVHLVMGYATLAEPQVFEPLLASNGSLLVALVLAGAWLVFFQRANRTNSRMATRALWFQVAAQLPLGMAICRMLAIPMFSASIWEPIWMSAAMGLSCSQMAAVSHDSSSPARLEKLFKLGTLLLPALAAIWWYAQTVWYYSNFHLGFNDFGHFGQRVANTAAGRGFLLETPVLPAFWDHFNPGLVLLVPLWWIFQSVHVYFAIQAICLAGSAWLIYAIARSRNAPPIACFVWLCAWLAHPALGQMNLAYTYGWHPITLAIPALLFSILMLIQRKYVFAFAFAILAMSFEEGVIVVLGCFAAACAIGSTGIYDKVIPFRRSQLHESNQQQVTRETGSGLCFGLATLTWIALCLSAIVTFVLVYRFSGLADFQTGRFVSLGNSAGEVLLAPILRPTAFWGAIFRPEKLAYLLCLLLPCFAVSLFRGKHILPTVCITSGSAHRLGSFAGILFGIPVCEHFIAIPLACDNRRRSRRLRGDESVYGRISNRSGLKYFRRATSL